MIRSRKPNRDSLSTWPSPWWPLQIPLTEAVDRVMWIGEGQHSRESFTSVLPDTFKTGVCAPEVGRADRFLSDYLDMLHVSCGL